MRRATKTEMPEQQEPPSWFPGKLTICALAYGNHADLCERLLGSIYRHTDEALFELRLGLNAVGRATHELVREYTSQHSNLRCHQSDTNLFKSPMMRRLFHETPIDTAWTAWFDDDSHVVRGDWLQRLAIKVQAHPEIDAWGVRYFVFPCKDSLAFARSASWYRGMPWSMRAGDGGKEMPCFDFPTGGFWVVRTRILQVLDWPDRRLQQAGDDFFFGEALRQNGYQVGTFDRGVAVSAAERRNASANEVARVPVM
jgi:GT2 family glycosyltransferase